MRVEGGEPMRILVENQYLKQRADEQLQSNLFVLIVRFSASEETSKRFIFAKG
jgi:Mg-chelatase subunit ChlD